MTNITSLRNTIGGSFNKPKSSDMVMFRTQLSEHSIAQDYLRIQKNLSEDTIKYFMLGYDYYRNLIAIPESKNGEMVNIAYRSLDKEAKIKYHKEKGCENWIFNERALEIAKEKQGILIVSNQFDAMSAHQAGFKNVVSVPVGKDATGMWMELFDSIPKIYISFENNKKMKKFGIEFADRLGSDKCFEVQLPEDIQDLNSYFKLHDSDEFKNLLREAKPYYKYTYQDLGTILDSIVENGDNRISLDIVPFIKLDIDYLLMVSGLPGVGKTTYVMNLTNRLVDMDIPVMVVPYERGARAVGQKFLGIRFSKTEDEIVSLNTEEIKELKTKVVDVPVYFSTPDMMEMRKTVERAKKLFGVRAVVIDHLEYNVETGSKSNEVDKMKIVMTEWKNICIELGVIFIVVHHVRKGQVGAIQRELTMEDMVGGGTPARVAEAVIMLSAPEEGQIKVSIVKNNHGKKGSKIFVFHGETGVVGQDITDVPELMTATQKSLDGFNKF